MTRETIEFGYLQTISWHEGRIIDWATGGQCYSLNGEKDKLGEYHIAFSFDSAITSPCGQYAFLYKRLGTKGLLFKNGDVLREINRSYYRAENYEYPAAFIVYSNETYLVHCPIKYCRIDFEHVETGEIVTNIPDRKPSDIFHSRLTVSEDNKHLMVCGWVWQPWDVCVLFNIDDCFNNPHLLDESKLYAGFDAEINTASFIDNTQVLIGTSIDDPIDDEIQALPQKHIAIWDFTKNELSTPVKVEGEFGNLIAINDRLAWDLYKFPKLINIQTGEIIDAEDDINSGFQRSSIIGNASTNTELWPRISFDRQSGKLAILVNPARIEVLSAE